MANNATSKNTQEAPAAKIKKPLRKSSASAAPKKKSPNKKAASGAEPTFPEKLFDGAPSPYHSPVAPYVWIDHPRQAEILHAAHYAIRLGVGGADAVELSIDGGSWQPCRSTSGYWWFDWSLITPGEHTLVARMRTYDGVWFRTPVRLCTYKA